MVIQLDSPYSVEGLSQALFADFPSITPAIHTQLLLLSNLHPSPKPDFIALWAEQLTKHNGHNVTVHDVTAWVRYQQALSDSSETGSSSYRPMTPAESTSPEPSSAMEVDSEESLGSAQPSLVPHWHAPPLPPPAAAHAPPKHMSISDVIRHINLSAIPPPSAPSAAAAGSHLASGSPPPQSIAEASRRFSPFTNAAETFLNLLEGGKLEALGWSKGPVSNGDDPFTTPV